MHVRINSRVLHFTVLVLHMLKYSLFYSLKIFCFCLILLMIFCLESCEISLINCYWGFIYRLVFTLLGKPFISLEEICICLMHMYMYISDAYVYVLSISEITLKICKKKRKYLIYRKKVFCWYIFPVIFYLQYGRFSLINFYVISIYHLIIYLQ